MDLAEFLDTTVLFLVFLPCLACFMWHQRRTRVSFVKCCNILTVYSSVWFIALLIISKQIDLSLSADDKLAEMLFVLVFQILWFGYQSWDAGKTSDKEWEMFWRRR